MVIRDGGFMPFKQWDSLLSDLKDEVSKPRDLYKFIGLWEISIKIQLTNKLILEIDSSWISCEIALRWMFLDLTDDNQYWFK